MPQSNWPDFVTIACEETWMDDSPTLLGEDFEKRWGGFTYEILCRVLSEDASEEHLLDERVFALFLVAYVAPEHAKDLLWPYVHANDVKERWAATISLARLHDPQAFPLLQNLLLTWLLDLQRYQTTLPEEVDAHWNSQRLFDMDWCGDRCHLVILLLGTWKDPQAVSTLRRAWQICWTNDQRIAQLNDDNFQRCELYQWHRFEDALAYTTGMLGAWETILYPGLSDRHFRIAVIYYTLGVLHIAPTHIFYRHGLPYFQDSDPPASSPYAFELGLVSLRSNPGLLASVLQEHFGLPHEKAMESLVELRQVFQAFDDHSQVSLRPEPVAQILQERFGLSQEEAREYIVGFRQAFSERSQEEHVKGEEIDDDQPF